MSSYAVAYSEVSAAREEVPGLRGHLDYWLLAGQEGLTVHLAAVARAPCTTISSSPTRQAPAHAESRAPWGFALLSRAVAVVSQYDCKVSIAWQYVGSLVIDHRFPRGRLQHSCRGELGIARRCHTGCIALTVKRLRGQSTHRFPDGIWRVAIGLGTRSPMGGACTPPTHAKFLTPNLFLLLKRSFDMDRN